LLVYRSEGLRQSRVENFLHQRVVGDAPPLMAALCEIPHQRRATGWVGPPLTNLRLGSRCNVDAPEVLDLGAGGKPF